MSWTGVYKDYTELPSVLKGNDHNFQEWIDKQVNRVKNLDTELELIKKRNSFFINALKNEAKNANVLDWGGSLGLTFFAVQDYVQDYNIVETQKVVCAGNKMKFRKLKFYENISEVPKVDIVYIRTALQYAKDWKEILNSLIKVNPKKIILAQLNSGDIETFLSIQNWGKHKVPSWFINYNSLHSLIRSNNFTQTHKSYGFNFKEDENCWKSILNFPKSKRIESTLNLIYENRN